MTQTAAASIANCAQWPKVAVMCGKMRNEAETLAILGKLVDWKREGIINEIIWSTWENEIFSSPTVAKLASAAQVYIIESSEPSQKSRVHQSRQFMMALKALPDDSWVFKCRTDKIVIEDVCKDFICSKLTPKHVAPEYNYLLGDRLKCRVVVGGIDMLNPFYSQDTVYLGRAGDLRQFVNFDQVCEGEFWGQKIPLEVELWSHPFLRESNVFARYFNRFDQGARSNTDLERGVRILQAELASPVYQRMLMTYYHCLRSYFICGFSPVPENILEFYRNPSVSLLDLLCPFPAKNSGVGAWQDVLRVYSNWSNWLEALDQNRLRITAESAALHRTYQELRSPSAHSNIPINPFNADPEADQLAQNLHALGVATGGPRIQLLQNVEIAPSTQASAA